MGRIIGVFGKDIDSESFCFLRFVSLVAYAHIFQVLTMNFHVSLRSYSVRTVLNILFQLQYDWVCDSPPAGS